MKASIWNKTCLFGAFLICLACSNSVFGFQVPKNVFKDIPIIEYDGKVIIGEDDIFENESFNFPVGIQYISRTDDFVLLDTGNRGMYFFSSDGSFKRRIGSIGQGPGEFINPLLFAVNRDENIYVYDSRNMRINIYNYDGSFINSFRVTNIYPEKGIESNFVITGSNDVVFNSPSRTGHYFSVVSQDGKLRNIGRIIKLDRDERINNMGSLGKIIINNDMYYIFLQYLFLLRIYNEKGLLTREVKLDILTGKPDIRKEIDLSDHLKRIDRGSYGAARIKLVNDIKMYNDNMYILTGLTGNEIREKSNNYILVYNRDSLKLEKIINLNITNKKPDDNIRSEYVLFCIKNDETVYMVHRTGISDGRRVYYIYSIEMFNKRAQ